VFLRIKGMNEWDGFSSFFFKLLLRKREDRRERETIYMNIYWGTKGVIDAKDFLTGRAVRSPPSLSSSFSLSSKVPKLLISFQAKKRRGEGMLCISFFTISIQSWWWWGTAWNQLKVKREEYYKLRIAPAGSAVWPGVPCSKLPDSLTTNPQVCWSLIFLPLLFQRKTVSTITPSSSSPSHRAHTHTCTKCSWRRGAARWGAAQRKA